MVDATQVQIRRGTQAECEGMVPVEGEVICDLTDDTLRVGDGIKAGGHLMPNVARMQSGKYMFATAGGTANAITVNLSPAVEFLTVGMEFRFLAVANNTGAVTLTLNGLAAMQVRKIQSGSPVQLDADDISSGVIYNVVYDGTYFVLFSGSGGGIVAPVGGTGHAIYRVLSSQVFSQSQPDLVGYYPPVNYENRLHGSWNLRVHVSGSVRIQLQQGQGDLQSRARVLLNSTLVEEWTVPNGAPFTQRAINSLNVSAGDVITIQNSSNISGNPAYGADSGIRNIVITSSTPAYGAISG